MGATATVWLPIPAATPEEINALAPLPRPAASAGIPAAADDRALTPPPA